MADRPTLLLDRPLIAVAGDWHGDTGTPGWSTGVVEDAALAGARMLLHTGDFGIWPGDEGVRWLAKLSTALADLHMRLWFVDGNHDWHPWILDQPVDSDGLRWLTARIAHIPRGRRWRWFGRTWVGLGGATSPDKDQRIPGREWWPEEAVTAEQAAAVAAAGRADVMVTHDVAAKVPLPLIRPWPKTWGERNLALAEGHRDRMQQVADAVQPKWWFHGHYHLFGRQQVDMGWGPCEVTSLHCNGGVPNWVLLNVETMLQVPTYGG